MFGPWKMIEHRRLDAVHKFGWLSFRRNQIEPAAGGVMIWLELQDTTGNRIQFAKVVEQPGRNLQFT